ncbi:hypothetical protein C8R45DRAFT_961171 [Mycena sanguinolenta]|nr:hypothetical protein C8R45DRAFT_961171 [Mycena sanguinolenta]
MFFLIASLVLEPPPFKSASDFEPLSVVSTAPRAATLHPSALYYCAYDAPDFCPVVAGPLYSLRIFPVQEYTSTRFCCLAGSDIILVSVASRVSL